MLNKPCKLDHHYLTGKQQHLDGQTARLLAHTLIFKPNALFKVSKFNLKFLSNPYSSSHPFLRYEKKKDKTLLKAKFFCN